MLVPPSIAPSRVPPSASGRRSLIDNQASPTRTCKTQIDPRLRTPNVRTRGEAFKPPSQG